MVIVRWIFFIKMNIVGPSIYKQNYSIRLFDFLLIVPSNSFEVMLVSFPGA